MDTKNNIILNIEANRGISHAIDKQLDKELGVDVTLNKQAWQSVFDIIKNDNATDKKQYSGGDTDITNGKHFIVKAGDYQVSQTAWAKIRNIAMTLMGLNVNNDKADDVNTKAATSAAELPKDESMETVKGMLNGKVEVSDEILKAVVEKYNAIIDYNKANNIETNEEQLSQRMVNLANGLKFKAVEAEFASNWANETETDTKVVNEDVKKAAQEGNMEDFKAAFHKAAREYIETYDNEKGDGKIDANELIKYSVKLEEARLGRSLTEDEIKIIQEGAINRIAILDLDKSDMLDEDEIAAYLWAMSKINDENTTTSHDITFDEWKTSEQALGILEVPQNELTQDMINNYGKFEQALKNGYEGMKQ